MITKKGRIPLVDLFAQYKLIKKEIDESIKRVLIKTDFIMGEEVAEFEEKFRNFLGVKHAFGVSSGTDAIHLALLACGLKEGDEVIIPSHTFTATAEPVIWIKAKPVFAEINKDSFTISPGDIEKKITSKTKAIIPVHLYGQPADMTSIIKLARKYKLKIIEDCAQAHGAVINNKMVGVIGDAGAFSFYPGKNLGAYGDAGAVVTNDDDVARTVSLLRNHGRKEKYTHEKIGYGNRLDTLQASVLTAKIKHLHDWNSLRRKMASHYREKLSGISQISSPMSFASQKSVYHLYVIKAEKRDLLRQFLKNNGIETGIHYPIPLHLQPAYKFLGYKKGDFPVTEHIAGEIISLPLYPEITVKQVNFICKCIEKFYS